MKVEELRIGNYLKYTDDEIIKPERRGKIFKVIAEDILALSGNPIDYIHPIPLTPEILEKAGFELFPWGWVKKASNDFGIRLNVQSFSYDVSGNYPVKLDYLHQLQNLYYALTGEELNVQL
jgi:hypothetical protein